jgi:hypothetical protein
VVTKARKEHARTWEEEEEAHEVYAESRKKVRCML